MKKILPLKCFFSKEVPFAKSPDEFLLIRLGLFHGNFDLSFANNEEGVTPGPLPDDVVAVAVRRLLQHVGQLDECVFG